MKIVKNKSVVVIDIPRICIPVDNAKSFVQAAEEFWSQTKQAIIEAQGSKNLKFDYYYSEGELIPVVRESNSYSDILDGYVSVSQIDKYVLKEEGDLNNEISEKWKLENNKEEK